MNMVVVVINLIKVNKEAKYAKVLPILYICPFEENRSELMLSFFKLILLFEFFCLISLRFMDEKCVSLKILKN